jgi:hypothetical protein
MTDKPFNSGRGGKRTGSGRRAAFTKPKDIKVRFEETEIEEITKALKPDVKLPAFIREAALRRLAEGW